MVYKANIQDIPIEKIPGREVRHCVNKDRAGASQMSLQIVDVLPGAVTKPGHTHTDCEEIIYVESGRGEILIQDTVWILHPGDVVHVPQGVKHLTRNLHEEKMRLICAFSSPYLKKDMVYHDDLDYPDPV